MKFKPVIFNDNETILKPKFWAKETKLEINGFNGVYLYLFMEKMKMSLNDFIEDKIY